MLQIFGVRVYCPDLGELELEFDECGECRLSFLSKVAIGEERSSLQIGKGSVEGLSHEGFPICMQRGCHDWKAHQS